MHNHAPIHTHALYMCAHTHTCLKLTHARIHTHTHTHIYSILPELQCVFGHMLESRLQYYVPEDFWKKFKLWGEPVNVREQQDAFDFFCNLTDQVDEQLKVTLLPVVYLGDNFNNANRLTGGLTIVSVVYF